MNEETLGESLLKVVTMMLLAIVVSLMLMAALDLHFRLPEEPAGKRSHPVAPHTADPDTDRPKHDQA